MRGSVIYTVHQMLLWWSKSKRIRRTGQVPNTVKLRNRYNAGGSQVSLHESNNVNSPKYQVLKIMFVRQLPSSVSVNALYFILGLPRAVSTRVCNDLKLIYSTLGTWRTLRVGDRRPTRPVPTYRNITRGYIHPSLELHYNLGLNFASFYLNMSAFTGKVEHKLFR